MKFNRFPTDMIEDRATGKKLSDKLAELESMNSNSEVTTARGSFESLGARLDNNDSQISQKVSQEYVDSQLAQKALQTDLITTNTNVSKKADITYVDTKTASLASGSPKGVYTTLSALQTAFPSGNSSTYVVTADGKWYYWNGSAWTTGGVYQSTLLPSNAGDQLVGYKNMYNSATVTSGAYIGMVEQLLQLQDFITVTIFLLTQLCH
jgi:hypothetical protein